MFGAHKSISFELPNIAASSTLVQNYRRWMMRMMMIMMTMVMILSIQRPVYCESRTRIKMRHRSQVRVIVHVISHVTLQLLEKIGKN